MEEVRACWDAKADVRTYLKTAICDAVGFECLGFSVSSVFGNVFVFISRLGSNVSELLSCLVHAYENQQWHERIGDVGDYNRINVSDPHLFKWFNDVKGKTMLDAGCGTGYLCRRFASEGATIIGVDLSPKMIEVSKANSSDPNITYNVDSVTTLETIGDESIDLIVSNYVIQDTPDYESAFKAFARVLKPGGLAFVSILHPCFDTPHPPQKTEEGKVFTWPRMSSGLTYYESFSLTQPPFWGNFTSPFVVYHRPLSAYWKTIKQAGLKITEFEEPGEGKYDCPCGCLFLLEK